MHFNNMKIKASILTTMLGALAAESRSTSVSSVMTMDSFLDLSLREYMAMTDHIMIADISPTCSAGLGALGSTAKLIPLLCEVGGSAPVATTTGDVDVTLTDEVAPTEEVVPTSDASESGEAEPSETTEPIIYNGTGIESIINRTTFDAIFSSRADADSCKNGTDLLTYDNFASAVNMYYPQMVINNGTRDQNHRNVAAFLAQISQETSGRGEDDPYTWGLCFPEELVCLAEGCQQYTDTTAWEYPPVVGKSYHGRGPMQISWNYNYGALSEALYGNKEVLLNQPEILVTDGVAAFRSALWFWTTQQWDKPACYDIMMETAIPCPHAGRVPGFGWTTNVINGGLECEMDTPQKVENRVQYYLRAANMLNVDPGNFLYCDEMLNYAADIDCPAQPLPEDELIQ